MYTVVEFYCLFRKVEKNLNFLVSLGCWFFLLLL